MASDDGRNWHGRNWLDISHEHFAQHICWLLDFVKRIKSQGESGQGVPPSHPPPSLSISPVHVCLFRKSWRLNYYFCLRVQCKQASKRTGGKSAAEAANPGLWEIGRTKEKEEKESIEGGFELIDMTKLRCPDALTL